MTFLRDHYLRIYFFAAVFIVVGLPLSKIAISIGEIAIFICWIFIEPDFKNRLKQAWSNNTVKAFSFFFVLHLIAVSYSCNWAFSFKQLKVELPILILPFIFSTIELDESKKKQILYFFLGAVTVSSLITMAGLYLSNYNNSVDTREYFYFVSHIRFGLMVALCIAIILVWVVKENKHIGYKILLSTVLGWFIFFLIKAELITGLIVSIGALLTLVTMMTVKSRTITSMAIGIFVFIAIIFGISIFVKKQLNLFYSFYKQQPLALLETTEGGEVYEHIMVGDLGIYMENGNYTWRNIAKNELIESWNKRGSINYWATTKNGKERIPETLIRFLTSKGLRKDAKGVNVLSEEEVKAIEHGIPNVLYMNMSPLEMRCHQLIWEIDNHLKGGDANEHSLQMRWEYWKTAIRIYLKQPFFGVGTGDLQDAFDQQYELDQTKLHPENRLRAHNQYLTYFVAYGLFGGIYFLFALVFSLFEKRKKSLFYIPFMVIMCLSFLTEDTLETQAGVTLFAFMGALFLFWNPKTPSEVS